MLAAGSNTIAALASRQFNKAELFEITLQSGAVLRFTDYDLPLEVGASKFLTNVVIERRDITQKIGLDPQTLDLSFYPKNDAQITPPSIGGLSLQRAAKRGLLDSAIVKMWKVYMAKPASGLATKTNNESVQRGVWKASEVEPDRMGVRLTLESYVTLLNVQMPRNLIQRGCVHTLFDAGCTLNPASFTTTSSVSATGPNTGASFTTSLSQANDYFALGVITFTSGANAGLSRTIKAYANTGGKVTLFQPLPAAPGTGDTFTIKPGCDKQQGTCSAKFSNLAHFRGMPYVPVPETLYDGGSVSAPAPLIGGQGVPGSGSPWPGNLDPNYTP